MHDLSLSVHSGVKLAIVDQREIMVEIKLFRLITIFSLQKIRLKKFLIA